MKKKNKIFQLWHQILVMLPVLNGIKAYILYFVVFKLIKINIIKYIISTQKLKKNSYFSSYVIRFYMRNENVVSH